MNYIEQIYNAIDPHEVERMAKSMKDGWIEVVLSDGELQAGQEIHCHTYASGGRPDLGVQN